MIIEYLDIVTILILIVLAILVIKLKILDIYGCLIASFIGITVLFGIGLNGLILLFVFFFSTYILTRFKYHEKRKTGLAQSKGGTRAWTNVLANGIITSLFALSYYFLNLEILLIPFITSISIATGDTISTEIGLLSKHKPRLITTFKKVESGRSGAITFLGTISGILSICSIILLAYFLNINQNYIYLLAAGIGGMIGITIDSYFGATIQANYICRSCNQLTESKIHHHRYTNLKNGHAHIDNNIVNLFSIFIGACSSVFLIYLII